MIEAMNDAHEITKEIYFNKDEKILITSKY